jgi:predicted transcriptional regulator
MSLRELSRKAGVGLATLVRLEAGTFDPRLSTLRKLTKALKVTVAELIGDSKPGKGVKKHGRQS